MNICRVHKAVSGWLIVMLFAFGLALCSFTSEAKGERVEVEIDGEVANAVVPVFVRDQRLFVPVRFVAERINVTLSWNEKDSTLSMKTVDGNEMLIKLDSSEVKWNGSTYYMDTAPVKRYGRIFVPAKHLAEIAGFDLKWQRDEDKIVFEMQEGQEQIVAKGEFKPQFLVAYDPDEIDLLAKIIAAEAGYEDIEGQIAVGNVILNRVENPKFPDTIRDVIYQPGQFGPVSSGKINRIEPSETTIEAAKQVLSGESVVEDAVYFYNPRVSKQAFWGTLDVVADIGNHRFLK